MPTITLNWTGVPDANPISPGSGFTSLGAGAAKVTSQVWSGNSASANTVWGCDTAPSGDTFASSFVMGPSDSNGRGVAIYNSSGNGFMFLARSFDIRVFALAAYVLSGSALATYTVTVAVDKIIDVDVTQSTGTYVVKYDGSTVGTYVNAAYTSGLRTGLLSRSGGIKSFSLTYTSSQTLDALTDPLVAGAAFSGTCTGFTDGGATISSNGLSVAVTVASGAFSGTWAIAVDEQAYPTLPKSAQTITLTQGGNTATIASDLEQPSGDDIVNFLSPVTDDDTYLTYYIEQDGFTADGGQFVFTSYSDLVIGTDGGALVTGAGTIVGYFIPATGTGAGNAYYYTFNIIDGGAVVSGGLSVAGLSNSGLSNNGLSVSGL